MKYVLLMIIAGIMIIFAGICTVRKFRKGGGCCGEHESIKLRKVYDRNPAHYAYHIDLDIGGMTCENCARRIENALNGLDGVWARVSFEKKTADVRCKSSPDEMTLRRAVSDAGYVVMGCTVL